MNKNLIFLLIFSLVAYTATSSFATRINPNEHNVHKGRNVQMLKAQLAAKKAQLEELEQNFMTTATFDLETAQSEYQAKRNQLEQEIEEIESKIKEIQE